MLHQHDRGVQKPGPFDRLGDPDQDRPPCRADGTASPAGGSAGDEPACRNPPGRGRSPWRARRAPSSVSVSAVSAGSICASGTSAASAAGGSRFERREGRRVGERHVAGSHPPQRGEVPADPQPLSQIVREPAHVEAGRAVDTERDEAALDAAKLQRIDRDAHGCGKDGRGGRGEEGCVRPRAPADDCACRQSSSPSRRAAAAGRSRETRRARDRSTPAPGTVPGTLVPPAFRRCLPCRSRRRAGSRRRSSSRRRSRTARAAWRARRRAAARRLRPDRACRYGRPAARRGSCGRAPRRRARSARRACRRPGDRP